MIARLKEKLQAWTQPVEEPAETGAPEERLEELPAPLPQTTTESKSEDSNGVWHYAWVFPDGVYYCDLSHADERLNQLVGLYEGRVILDTDELMGYCTFGEVDILALSRERLLALDKRFQQCAVPLAAARVLWQYGLLTLDNAALVQQGDLKGFPQAVVQQVEGLSVRKMNGPVTTSVALNLESLRAAVEGGEGQAALCDLLAHLSDRSSVRRATYWLSQCARRDNAEQALPLVDSLVSCPVAEELMPAADSELARGEALAKLSPEAINLLQNLYISVHLWGLENRQAKAEAELNEVYTQELVLQEALQDRPTTLWVDDRIRQLKAEKVALENLVAPFQKAYDGIKALYEQKEQKRILKQFQGQCQRELNDETLRALLELIGACQAEQPLQEMAGTVLALGYVARYPVEAQLLASRMLTSAAEGVKLDLNELMRLDAIEERLDTLDNLSRLYLLTENQVIDTQVARTDERIQSLGQQLSDGSLADIGQQIRAQQDLEQAEEKIELYRQRQAQLHELVQRLGEDRREQGDILRLIDECLEEGPKARLTRATGLEKTLMESVGLNRLMEVLLTEEGEQPSPLLYAMLQELHRLWEPMTRHGYFFIGYGISPKEVFKGGLGVPQYEAFTKELEGHEPVEGVYPLFVNCLRQYANRYDWVRGFGEGEEPGAEDRAKVRTVLQALTEGRYTDYLDLFDSPACYERHLGRGLERFNVLRQLGQVIHIYNDSLKATSFTDSETFKRKLELALVVLRNEAFRALNIIKKEEV